MIPDNLPEARCAYGRCQAGGTILAGAPRVERKRTDLSGGQFNLFHPGCWQAQLHHDEWLRSCA